jgi:hypothetical protein
VWEFITFLLAVEKMTHSTKLVGTLALSFVSFHFMDGDDVFVD